FAEETPRHAVGDVQALTLHRSRAKDDLSLPLRRDALVGPAVLRARNTDVYRSQYPTAWRAWIWPENPPKQSPTSRLRARRTSAGTRIATNGNSPGSRLMPRRTA